MNHGYAFIGGEQCSYYGVLQLNDESKALKLRTHISGHIYGRRALQLCTEVSGYCSDSSKNSINVNFRCAAHDGHRFSLTLSCASSNRDQLARSLVQMVVCHACKCAILSNGFRLSSVSY